MLIKQAAKKILFAKSGNRCSFPDCDELLINDSGVLIGEICHIEAMASGGPRYNSSKTAEEISSLDNLIALCPTHHRVIDTEPFIYTGEWLRRAKAQHEKTIEMALAGSTTKPIDFSKISTLSLSEALNIWQSNDTNNKEEFWQKFFEENPRIIAQAVPNHIVKLGQKSYVGGKSIENQSGNLVDFLFCTQSSKNVTLVEIKTPATKLIGPQYRSNVYSMSEELSGSVVQVLNYRDELLKNYYALSGHGGAPKFLAFNPKCLIIAGNLNRENPNGIQKKSFDLFRSNLGIVDILTYDELFAKVKDLVDILA